MPGHLEGSHGYTPTADAMGQKQLRKQRGGGCPRGLANIQEPGTLHSSTMGQLSWP